MAKSTRVQVGEVISSPLFVFGGTDSQQRLSVGHCFPEQVQDEETKEFKLTGNWCPGCSANSIDESRATAQYVVERTGMQGGGTGHGPHDVFPDGWHVTARRLNEDGSYDPEGEEINFYQSGSFTCMVNEVEVQGKKSMAFV